jgi:hypothetical protein
VDRKADKLPDSLTKTWCHLTFPWFGDPFAQNEEKVLVAKIVKNFKITSLDKNPRMVPELILRPADGIHIKVEKRGVKA